MFLFLYNWEKVKLYKSCVDSICHVWVIGHEGDTVLTLQLWYANQNVCCSLDRCMGSWSAAAVKFNRILGSAPWVDHSSFVCIPSRMRKLYMYIDGPSQLKHTIVWASSEKLEVQAHRHKDKYSVYKDMYSVLCKASKTEMQSYTIA